jgi:transcriptional antiterminator NusG
MAEELKQNESAEQAQGDAAPAVPATPAPTNPNFKWYIIHSYSGFERKVKESIESRVQAFGLQDKIGRVMIPTEPVTEIRNGKKYTIERAFLPGYVLVEMDLNDDVWHIIKSTPRVTGFLGTGQHPSPLTEDEVNQIVYRIDTGKDKPKLKVKFQKNEQVRITEGPFATFTGVIDDVNEDKSEVTVMVTIFGRSTPVKLEFGQVDKVVA